jgi:hypothetical protein
MAEMYYRRQLKASDNPRIIRYRDQLGTVVTPEDRARLEAERLFRAYRQKFKLTEWQVVSIEESLPVSDKDKALVKEAVMGLDPFTFKPDLVVHMSPQQAEKIEVLSGEILEPGYYMVDYKTAARREKYRQITREHSLPIGLECHQTGPTTTRSIGAMHLQDKGTCVRNHPCASCR